MGNLPERRDQANLPHYPGHEVFGSKGGYQNKHAALDWPRVIPRTGKTIMALDNYDPMRGGYIQEQLMERELPNHLLDGDLHISGLSSNAWELSWFIDFGRLPDCQSLSRAGWRRSLEQKTVDSIVAQMGNPDDSLPGAKINVKAPYAPTYAVHEGLIMLDELWVGQSLTKRF